MSITFYVDGESLIEDEFSVNFSNANAWRILGALDIDQDYCGSICSTDLKGRILTAMAVGGKATLDVADPASRGLLAALSGSHPGHGPTVHDCGPKTLDGLLEPRLPMLLAVAERAEALGRPVSWA